MAVAVFMRGSGFKQDGVAGTDFVGAPSGGKRQRSGNDDKGFVDAVMALRFIARAGLEAFKIDFSACNGVVVEYCGTGYALTIEKALMLRGFNQLYGGAGRGGQGRKWDFQAFGDFPYYGDCGIAGAALDFAQHAFAYTAEIGEVL